jgi:hypothetical protein
VRSYDGGMEPADVRKRLLWSIVALFCSVPWALLIVVHSGQPPWMSILFAGILAGPHIIIWHRYLFSPGRPSAEHNKQQD